MYENSFLLDNNDVQAQQLKPTKKIVLTSGSDSLHCPMMLHFEQMLRGFYKHTLIGFKLWTWKKRNNLFPGSINYYIDRI